MTQKLFCLCAVCALLFVFATANVASAETVVAPSAPAATACPCGLAAAPGCTFSQCCPPVAYRVGLFGAIRPVVYAPVYRPVYVPPRYVYPPRYVCPPYRPVVACPPYYCW